MGKPAKKRNGQATARTQGGNDVKSSFGGEVDIVPFRGRPGRVLWERIGENVKQVPNWLDHDGLPRLEHTLDFVNFFMDAAWCEDVAGTGRQRRFASRRERIENRWAHNQHIYRLSVGNRRIDVLVEYGKVQERFSLGRVRGCTAVLPLCSEGAHRYLAREKAYGDLDEEDILPYSPDPYRTQWLLINSVVHFPSIRRLEAYQEMRLETPPPSIPFVGEDPPTLSGYGVLVDLFAHVERFAGRLIVESETPPRVVAERLGAVYPRILCPVTGHGVGEPELLAAGFADIGGDKFGNTVYVFDIREINREDAAPRRRQRMLRTVKTATVLQQ